MTPGTAERLRWARDGLYAAKQRLEHAQLTRVGIEQARAFLAEAERRLKRWDEQAKSEGR